jgi:hypothetical protein
MKPRIAALTILCLALAAIPASAQWSYENGPINGNQDGWTINFGYTVSDSYVAGGALVDGFAFGLREFPGDKMTSVDWILSTGPCSDPSGGCGTIVGSGTANGSNLTDKFLSYNEFGYQVDLITVSNLNVPENSGTEYWLTLANGVVPSGDPVFWDENSGVGCHSQGCPSTAYESILGTIPSEDFTISGGGTTPEPSSIMLFGSGILGLAGVLRRKLF